MVNNVHTILIGQSGKSYLFRVYPIDKESLEPNGYFLHKDMAVCYVFCKETAETKFQSIYVGETGDASQRYDNHHKADCIRECGATHIAFYYDDMANEFSRMATEQDLIQGLNPPCNG